jgi:hypothetical protein
MKENGARELKIILYDRCKFLLEQISLNEANKLNIFHLLLLLAARMSMNGKILMRRHFSWIFESFC